MRFILCVVVTESLEGASYKLYTVQLNRWNRAIMLPDINTVPVAAIPPDTVSGERFPEPIVDVDLFAILVRARRNIP
jgi:hypothetical protein